MNHRSHMIVIPNSSKQRGAFFQHSRAVKVPFVYPGAALLQSPLWHFSNVPQDVLKGRAMGPVEEDGDITSQSVSTKSCMCSGMFMCACKYKDL